MNDAGLLLACRYSFPPNSLSLCGPSKQQDLSWYSSTQKSDAGTTEILKQFSTLYPYLCFIAGENNLKNPFDLPIIEAYWLGNSLLHRTHHVDFLRFLDDGLSLPKKITKIEGDTLQKKVAHGAFPHHAFHVLNVYRRTGHVDIPQTIETMDACIINWGKIIQIIDSTVVVETKPLRRINQVLMFAEKIHRKLRMQGETDTLVSTLRVGDWVSYHWGYVCQKLTQRQRINVESYTNHALRFANTPA